jgi:hypothetical protein
MYARVSYLFCGVIMYEGIIHASSCLLISFVFSLAHPSTPDHTPPPKVYV